MFILIESRFSFMNMIKELTFSNFFQRYLTTCTKRPKNSELSKTLFEIVKSYRLYTYIRMRQYMAN